MGPELNVGYSFVTMVVSALCHVCVVCVCMYMCLCRCVYVYVCVYSCVYGVFYMWVGPTLVCLVCMNWSYSSTRCVWGEEVFKSISIGQGLGVWLSNEVMS